MKLKFKFTRSAAKPYIGVTTTPRDISESKGDPTKQILNNFKDGVCTIKGMDTNNQSAATAFVKNPVSIMDLIESYEAGLTGMQGVVADMQEIVNSIDNVLEKFETIDSSDRDTAEKEEITRTGARR